MRRLSLSNKKLRNIPRRLRALTRWADSFEGSFYSELPLDRGFENEKIPVIESLVEGKQTTPEILAHCAQQLIRAAGYLLEARPDEAPECWVVANIMIPDMSPAKSVSTQMKAATWGPLSRLSTNTFVKPASSVEVWPVNGA